MPNLGPFCLTFCVVNPFRQEVFFGSAKWVPTTCKYGFNSIYRGEITPVTHLEGHIYIGGPITPFIVGAHLVVAGQNQFPQKTTLTPFSACNSNLETETP